MRALAVLWVAAAFGAEPVENARVWRAAHEKEILAGFTTLLAIPNVARDTANIGRNAEWILAEYAKRGVKTRLLEVAGAPPVVFGEWNAPGAKRTVTFYAHYDGQPVEPAKWATPPFTPVFRDGRIWARSASDDKAPIVAFLAAIDAMRAAGIAPSANVRFFFEGEEEAGSPHLPAVIEKYREALKTDVWFVCDGPMDQSRKQQIYFGARGVVPMELTVYGPNHELHSGHYGNWAPNPAMMMARLLASMKDDDGRVLVDHYYDGIEPLSETEKRALAASPANDAALMHELGLARAEGGGKRLNEMLMMPSLNVQGMGSASIGPTTRNVVPSTATATLDLRLVKGIDVKTAVGRVTEHVRKQGYYVVDKDPDLDMRLTHPKIAKIVVGSGYNAARTSMDLPVSRRAIQALERARGQVVAMPTLGGSVPLYLFTDVLKTPAIGIPIANHDNNQHSSNENIIIQNLWDGIETMTALLTMRPE
jgi:acetylornithine deacetylase/succinyl-diaminopimelate desuccinylase-like protein